MFTLAGLLSLIFGFTVLLVTFAWLARMLERPPRTHRPTRSPESGPDRPSVAAGHRGVGNGDFYGLVLGVLACVLFWLSPLTLALSVAALYYGGRGVAHSLRWHTGSFYRAVSGLFLGAGSVVLHYLSAIGDIPSRPF